MADEPKQFAVLSRILHWLMAAMLLAMLFIGVAMVASLGNYHRLVAIHRPLGILILILAAIRFVNRMLTTLPPFLPTMSERERFLASVSERLLYALMFALPLVGWGMLSAGQYPSQSPRSEWLLVEKLKVESWRRSNLDLAMGRTLAAAEPRLGSRTSASQDTPLQEKDDYVPRAHDRFWSDAMLAAGWSCRLAGYERLLAK